MLRSLSPGRLFWLAVFASALAGEAKATDWPRFRGLDLRATSPDPILCRWPTNGLGAAWRIAAPGGQSSFAVSEGRVYTLRTTNTYSPELCVALDSARGTQIWAVTVGISYVNSANSTPTVKDGRVYVYSNALKLFCLDKESGSVVWEHDLAAEYGSSVRPDNSQSPWVEDGRVFVSIDAPTNCLMAFNATNGALLWRGHTNRLSYASPIAATIHGVRQVIFPDKNGLVSVTPDSGQLLWRHRRGNYLQQGPSPVISDDLGVCVTEDIVGGEVFRIQCSGGVFTTTSLWTNSTLRGTYVTSVIREGCLYGIFGNALQCMDLTTGQVNWSSPAVRNGTLILAGDCLLALTEDGRLVLARASPLGYEQLSACRILAAGIQTLNSPAYSNGRIYARNPNEMVCVDAAIPAPLQVSATFLPGADRVALRLSSSDGSPIYTNRVPQISLRWTTDLSQALDQWLPLPGPLVYTNGALYCEEPLASNSVRFYTGVEQGR
jgi:outer membrane protein assembly factor BamB